MCLTKFYSHYEALVLDHEEDKGDEVIEDYIANSYEEEEKSNKGNQASISSSIEDKGLVSHVPLQISVFFCFFLY